MTEPLITHIWEAAAALASLIGLLVLLVVAVVENIRDRIAAKEAAKRDRLDTIMRMSFRDAFMRGLIDEQGNIIDRVGDK